MFTKASYYSIAAVCAVLLAWNAHAAAQPAEIGGVVNRYAKVVAVNGDRVTLSAEASTVFSPENLPDTVLLMQMTGVSVDGTRVNRAGKYEFNIVTAFSGTEVTLKSAVAPDMFTLNADTAELVQMIRVPSYRSARITEVLTCTAWSWTAGTGGVLAIMVRDTLAVDADVDVSGMGFSGGAAIRTQYTGPCTFSAPDGTDAADYPASSILAGHKGEGAVTSAYFDPGNPASSVKGYGRTANGGGGGNGKWAGGGGGGNGNYGGNGGVMACGVMGFMPGDMIGPVATGNNGFPFKYLELPSPSRVFMGGGGGSGTGIDGTDGGNGGGIVMIIAGKMQFSGGAAVKASGASVTGALPHYAGAGGGGGGGSIVLSAGDYGEIRAEVNGGNGGGVYRDVIDCYDENFSRGAGGGGGGGMIHTTKNLIIDSEFYGSFSRSGGTQGSIEGGGNCPGSALPGSAGICMGDYRIQLNGFLYNYITVPDTVVCYGDLITVAASQPEGGTSPYVYRWESSPDGLNNWAEIPGAIDPALQMQFTGNVYVRRVVTSGATPAETVTDRSFPVAISVYQAISNDIAVAKTALCWEPVLAVVENAVISGGGGAPYAIEWHAHSGAWAVIEGASGNSLDAALPATADVRTYRYRRTVTSSKGCVSTAETADITVLPVITDNTVTPEEQVLCGDTAEEIVGTSPAGGNGAFAYRWQITAGDTGEWSDIDGDDAGRKNYRPVTDTHGYGMRLYRRRIISGECTALSNAVAVHFYEEPAAPSVIITPDRIDGSALVFKFDAVIEADMPTVGGGVWSSSDSDLIFDPPSGTGTVVSNLKLGLNTAVWTVSNGACVMPADSVMIFVHDIIIPDGFSPNGDGFNDCFRVVGGENTESMELIVFDRYNRTVFVSRSFRGGVDLHDCAGWWDGRDSSGNILPAGAYYYRIILNGDKIYNGYVVIKR